MTTDGTMNLTAPRSEKSVWDAPTLSTRLSGYDQDRWMTAAWGTGLAVLGARRGGFAGGVLAMAGSAIAVRAAMGRQDLGVAREWINRRLKGHRPEDVVESASEESFPASDPPGWTTAAATTER